MKCRVVGTAAPISRESHGVTLADLEVNVLPANITYIIKAIRNVAVPAGRR